METRKGDTIDESALGANASAEEQQEQMEEAGAKTGIDVVLNHQLQDISHLLPKKTDVKNYLKKYVKK